MAAREEKEETALTARANEICVVLATQKYYRLVFVAPLTLSVGWAGVQGIYLDGLKKRSLV